MNCYVARELTGTPYMPGINEMFKCSPESLPPVNMAEPRMLTQTQYNEYIESVNKLTHFEYIDDELLNHEQYRIKTALTFTENDLINAFKQTNPDKDLDEFKHYLQDNRFPWLTNEPLYKSSIVYGRVSSFPNGRHVTRSDWQIDGFKHFTGNKFDIFVLFPQTRMLTYSPANAYTCIVEPMIFYEIHYGKFIDPSEDIEKKINARLNFRRNYKIIGNIIWYREVISECKFHEEVYNKNLILQGESYGETNNYGSSDEPSAKKVKY